MRERTSRPVSTRTRVIAGIAAGTGAALIALPAIAVLGQRDAAASPAPSSASIASAVGPASTAATGSRAAGALEDQARFDRLAQAVHRLGRSGFATNYTGVVVDLPKRRLMIYTTDLNQGARLADQAVAAVSEVDRDAITIRRATYSAKALEAAQRRIAASGRGHGTTALGAATDGSGLVAFSAADDAGRRALAAQLSRLAQLPVTVLAASPLRATTPTAIPAA